jgi:hypothetical protein
MKTSQSHTGQTTETTANPDLNEVATPDLIQNYYQQSQQMRAVGRRNQRCEMYGATKLSFKKTERFSVCSGRVFFLRTCIPRGFVRRKKNNGKRIQNVHDLRRILLDFANFSV